MPGPAQGNPMEKDTKITHLCRFSDDHASAMIDKNPFPDFSSGVDLYTRPKSAQIGNKPGKDRDVKPGM